MGKMFIIKLTKIKLGYIFEKIFTIKKFGMKIPVFTQGTIYHVRTEMRQSVADYCFNAWLYYSPITTSELSNIRRIYHVARERGRAK